MGNKAVMRYVKVHPEFLEAIDYAFDIKVYDDKYQVGDFVEFLVLDDDGKVQYKADMIYQVMEKANYKNHTSTFVLSLQRVPL